MHLYNHLLGQEEAFSVLSATLGVFSHPIASGTLLLPSSKSPTVLTLVMPSLCVSVALALKEESYTMSCLCYL